MCRNLDGILQSINQSLASPPCSFLATPCAHLPFHLLLFPPMPSLLHFSFLSPYSLAFTFIPSLLLLYSTFLSPLFPSLPFPDDFFSVFLNVLISSTTCLNAPRPSRRRNPLRRRLVTIPVKEACSSAGMSACRRVTVQPPGIELCKLY